MFDISNPQKRERLLIILACVVLFGIVMGILPTIFDETRRLELRKQKLISDIEVYERHVRNKDVIQSRLTNFEKQALAFSGSAGDTALSGYQIWLGELARSAGLRDYSSPAQAASPLRDIYTRHIFTVNAVGGLEQIAEFLRRFHRTEYLHLIQSVQPRPIPNRLGEFNVAFRIEALALPQVRLVNLPGTDAGAVEITDDERAMLATIGDRAILSAYVPPRPPPPDPPPPPPVVEFDDVPFCFVTAIVESDGVPQVWIHHRTTGRRYFLFEGESFVLGGIRCIVRRVDVENQRIQIELEEVGLFSIRVGQHFDEIEPIETE